MAVTLSVHFHLAFLCSYVHSFWQRRRQEFHRFDCEPSPPRCRRYLRLHFLQQVPSTCTGSKSSEQLAGGQKILRHSTTPFCQEIHMHDVNLTTCKTGTQAPGIDYLTVKKHPAAHLQLIHLAQLAFQF